MEGSQYRLSSRQLKSVKRQDIEEMYRLLSQYRLSGRQLKLV